MTERAPPKGEKPDDNPTKEAAKPEADRAAQPDKIEQLPGRSYRHRYDGPFFRRLLVGGIRWLPRPVKRATMPLWAGLFYGLLPDARHAVEDNLDQLLGPASLLGRKARGFRLFWHYAQMLSDSYSIHLGQDLGMEIISIGRHHLLDAHKERRGVIATTGHLGMWQVGPFLVEWRELGKFYMAMAEEPNPLAQQFEEQFRNRFRIIYTTGSPFSSLPILQALREGAIVGMQMDRHLGGQTIPVSFCGRVAPFAAGPATLARLSGSPMVPIFFMIEPGKKRRVVQYIEEPIFVPHTAHRDADIAEGTRRLVAVYERYVQRYPTQWFHFHSFWPPVSP